MIAIASLRLALLTTAIALLPACASQGPRLHGDAASSVLDSIEAVWRAHAAAARSRDAQSLAQIYTDDAVYLVEGQQPIVGKKDLAAMGSRVLDEGNIQDIHHHCDALRVDGDLAWELGTVAATAQPEGQAAQTVTFHFIAMWKLGTDRRWRIGHIVGQVEATLVVDAK